MRIGIDCRLWNETGVGRYIRNLVANLQKLDKKNEYFLFVLSKDGKKVLNLIQNDKFKIIETNIKWHTLGEQLGFPQILNRENLDLMHFPYFSVPIFYNRPFVVTIHDLIVDHFSTGKASTLPWPIYQLKRLAYKLMLGQAAKKAGKIIAVSNATKQEIISNLRVNKEKVSVTYEAADLKLQTSNLRIENLGIKGSYFLCVGNAYPHKNLDRLIEAFKMIDSDVTLVLVGREDYFYERLKKKAKKINLSERVIFLQNISDEELSGLYQNAIALIIPSLMEGFGLPALEAMANNCLVLASDTPSLREICADSAVYFDPYKVQDIAKKMKDAYSGAYSENKKKGLDRVKLFSWDKMAKKTLEIYESCFSL